MRHGQRQHPHRLPAPDDDMAEHHYCIHFHHDGDVNIYDNGDHAEHRRLNYDGHRGVLHNVIQFAIDHYPDIVIDLVADAPDILRALDRRRDTICDT